MQTDLDDTVYFFPRAEKPYKNGFQTVRKVFLSDVLILKA